MHRVGKLVLALIVVAATITCARITVNVYFPAAEIQDAAAEIEDEVRGDATVPADTEPPAEPEQKEQDSSFRPRLRHVRVRLGPAAAIAQGIDLNVTTPQIRKLIAGRKKRYPGLVALFAQGALGENNQGLIDIRTLDGLSLKDKARAKTLREQENRDRQQLYRELAAANNLPQEQVAKIATIFANVNRQKAQAGWWIQEANGQWKKK